jgi:hypothetical protein
MHSTCRYHALKPGTAAKNGSTTSSNATYGFVGSKCCWPAEICGQDATGRSQGASIAGYKQLFCWRPRWLQESLPRSQAQSLKHPLISSFMQNRLLSGTNHTSMLLYSPVQDLPHRPSVVPSEGAHMHASMTHCLAPHLCAGEHQDEHVSTILLLASSCASVVRDLLPKSDARTLKP